MHLSQKRLEKERNGANFRPLQGYCMQNCKFNLLVSDWLINIFHYLSCKEDKFPLFQIYLIKILFRDPSTEIFYFYVTWPSRSHDLANIIWEYKAKLLWECVVFVHRHKNRWINAKYTWRSLVSSTFRTIICSQATFMYCLVCYYIY